MPESKFALLGFGNVGRALARLLLAKDEELRQQYDLSWRVVGIATQRHGAALDPAGIDLEKALALVEAEESLLPLSVDHIPLESVGFIHATGADVLFENTPVNYETGQPAVDHIKAALEAGMHAITANKGPVVHAYRELTNLAQKQRRRFFFESAVMDGAPIFSLWRETLPASQLRAFRGVLNSTTNLILTLMEQGKSFDQAVTHAQDIGIAETDPSGDTQGWDAAVKVAALVTVLMDTPLKPHQVDRQGIEALSLEDIASARAAGKRWKLVCQAELDMAGVNASVHPELIGPDDPLFNVMGTSSAVTFQSDVLGDLTVMESDPGPHTTAYGLMADCLNAILHANK